MMKAESRNPVTLRLILLATSFCMVSPFPASAETGAPTKKQDAQSNKQSNKQSEHAKPDAQTAIKTASKLPPAESISAAETQAHIATLRSKKLRMPVDGADIEKVKGNFYLGRVGHMHEAIDVTAPRNTPVHAVEDGTIERFFESKNGGLTIYQKDKSGKYVYYYAHLERYDDNVHPGDKVKAGQVIGYVGTSGNAPPNTPHLHFAISTIGPQDSVFRGTALDPYEVYKTR